MWSVGEYQARTDVENTRYPPEYVIALQISSVAMEIYVIGVKILANKPEMPHSHTGGFLFHFPRPIRVCSSPDNVETYQSDRSSNDPEVVSLGAATPHYATTTEDYEGVFIEIDRKKNGAPAGQVKIEESLDLEKSPHQRFLISQEELPLFGTNAKVSHLLFKNNIRFFTYHLHPGTAYQMQATRPVSFYVLEI